ncbi:bifunctional 5,10-methylenetetrahydrofolate dehydrogenase/5,10-methenyltetrahydrofolate cyclohydrolase [bacterium]|nr:bifunctional 5,10-methylenetetrahydrofolate dehydrogenase/5,10-methenyltetrahydrofolate cyclohydrolase [candidate division CSSED10-310 bacterium]
MNTMILDGRKISGQVLETIREDVMEFTELTGRQPGLAVIHAGSDPASAVYVKNKQKACKSVGIDFRLIDLPDTASPETILAAIDRLNEMDSCDGLLVQLPLPSPEFNENEVIHRIAVAKDVDGFHPESIGNLWSGAGIIAPCTPAGVMELLKSYGVPIAGKSAVIVGRSNIVGKPMAALLLREHATVTIAHSRSVDLPSICRQADILVAAVGKPGLLGREHIKPGSAVIDVGINRITLDNARAAWRDPDTEIGAKLAAKGFALIGDVDPLAVDGVAAWYSPVPGGVGPMTVAMLIKNTLILAKKRNGITL